jgi:hypothetical protein
MVRFVSKGTLSALLAAACLLVATTAIAGPLSGAIFTTDEDGNRVNQNLYEAKEDVYLDGGPGPNAPSGAAGLPAGDYYFQVTDPSGKTLLSTDPVKCRRFTVSDDGVITSVDSVTLVMKVKGKLTDVDCTHATGVDQDHSELGAITVQLMPYDDTPNKGGVYKVWVTPVDDFVGDPDKVDNPKYFHGFVPSCSKTDNFKVKKKGKPVVPPTLTIRKFHDADMDCVEDEGEAEITGWKVFVTDTLGATNTYHTPITIYVEAGTVVVEEETPAGTLQTVALLDDVKDSCYPNADAIVEVLVDGDSEETHEVVYGNIGLGEIKACKFYDRDADGTQDAGEPAIEGWKMKLTGTDSAGTSVGPIYEYTDSTGCAVFTGLAPGDYTVEEIMAGTGETGITWVASTAKVVSVSIGSSVSGSTVVGETKTVKFGNYCSGATADFDTKGYWHNKNGLAELTETEAHFQDVLDCVNGLDPYDDATGYFGKGDEPFDGEYDDGSDADAAKGVLENENIAPAGSAEAEISNFLIDSVGDGGIREQLAQQLLAFIFNTIHRLDCMGALIEADNGDWVCASDLIDDAVALWTSGSDQDRTDMKTLLDDLNNSDSVPYVPYFPCDVVYD